jgi:hypothetical protein
MRFCMDNTKRRKGWDWHLKMHQGTTIVSRSTGRPTLANNVLAALRVLPGPQARDMRRLLSLAQAYVPPSITPPWDTLPPEGDPA